MKPIVYYFLNKMFGKKNFYKLFLIFKNIGLQGLNYRNTNIETNGELYLIKKIANFYGQYNKKLILFDVGANIGNYSKELNKHFLIDKTIYAFEPCSFPFLELKKNALKYPSIKAYNIGLSNKFENKIIYSSENYSEIGGLYDRSITLNNITLDLKETNQFLTLDSFCETNEIEHVNFLKIDVEGHEFMILEGGNFMIENNKIDFIQFEFGTGNHFSRTYLLDFFNLLNKNYKFYRILSDGFVDVTNYNSDLEMQIVTNYLAVNKLHSDNFSRHVDFR